MGLSSWGGGGSVPLTSSPSSCLSSIACISKGQSAGVKLFLAPQISDTGVKEGAEMVQGRQLQHHPGQNRARPTTITSELRLGGHVPRWAHRTADEGLMSAEKVIDSLTRTAG